MLNHSMKGAIKYGLALIITMMLSMWLGWSKTSWSMLTVTVLAVLDTYGYSAKKGHDRLLGTVIGTAVAFLMIGLFVQQRALFIASMTAFMWVCVYFQSHRRWAYTSNLAITVCVIIGSSISADSVSVISTAIIRMEETVLGVVVFSVVYRLVWPSLTDEAYFSKLQSELNDLQSLSALLKKGEHDSDEIAKLLSRVKKSADSLKELLSLPVEPNEYLFQHRKKLHSLTALIDDAIKIADQEASRHGSMVNSFYLGVLDELLEELARFVESRGETDITKSKDAKLAALPAMLLPKEKRLYFANLAACVMLTTFVLWIIMPVPMGVLFPTFAGIFAANVMAIPGKAVKYIMLIYVGIAAVLILQFVFIMPAMTEAWQILALYFVNAVFLFGMCDFLKVGALKALAGNVLVNVPSSAVEPVPSYNILSPLNLLVVLCLSLLIIEFYAKVFSIKAAQS
ncbi:FUSC family protein [Ferrimonas marina]|uniref:Uncharacterized membrane protein YccC n=1 Tax=Ferrimonas marina TaxID=299255 RepID=A0A1M5RDQ2_9GAMM|nr:FUSC family protein [Ferrimonas marina]SHH24424.1 Uncharacterized membrane protein YccC [Ferrimonas marina]